MKSSKEMGLAEEAQTEKVINMIATNNMHVFFIHPSFLNLKQGNIPTMAQAGCREDRMEG
jgi:hypothetical protein